ncbi:M24 family metallopeptidase [Agrobacterium larrymoorei]|uniref:Aminopeptidase P family protein n=1 Tax=Agrobacterium larrymoorei TaxID=160699 RepID=A0A4D7E4H4_9HYPH|nr:M24 family metallopeptidase [Agrobacterium larrymoorei]QCJ01007.1 aminopeptidase P family protein [Agrobacterium larrymoorei]QYA10343.1 aminopeptidase P family protein [Agrobacterium larrymoorei]
MALLRKHSSKEIFSSTADYRNRVARLQAEMKKIKLEIIVLHGSANHRFFTGLDGLPDVRPIFLIVRPEAEPVFVSPRIEAVVIRKKCPERVIAEWGDWEEPGLFRSFEDAIAALIKNEAPQAATIGIDYDTITALNLNLLVKKIHPVCISNVSDMIGDIRRFNDVTVMEHLSRAAEVAVDKFRAISDAIAPGITEWQAALKGFCAATECVAKYLEGDENHSPLGSSFTVMGSGSERSAHAHSVAAGRVMEDGDLVQICCCTPIFLGQEICFDRPVFVGTLELPQPVKNILQAAREASAAAWALVRPGVTAGEVHNAALEVIVRYGYEEGMQHGTGRSIGCGGVGFRIKAGDPTVLKEGDIIGIEPGVYGYGVGGARYGDTGVVLAEGCEIITPFQLARD